MSEIKPLVAIHCLVYNHEPYLRECFEGFVMQQTNFPFVAIVHDDASTDGSVAIIREYEEKYPHIFKPIYEQENLYQKGGFGTINEVMNAAIDATCAKYVAICEGDDYWTDPLKLQRQVNFMEEHEEVSLCFHKVIVLSDNNKVLNLYDDLIEKEYTAHEIYDKWTIPTNSVLYKRSQLILPKMKYTIFGDIVLFLSLASVGKVFCMDFVGGVYRRISSGVTSTFSNNTYRLLYHQYDEMKDIFPFVQDISIRRQCEFLSYVIHDVNCVETWKYRFLYMWKNKKLFFSSFFTTTILSYMLIPFVRKYIRKQL